MAIAEVSSQRNTTGGGASTSVTFTYPATPTQGNLLVAGFSYRGDTSVSGTPTGWSLARANAAATGIDGAIYYKIAGASEPTVHTWTLAASNKSSGVASEWSGISATPFDKSASAAQTLSTSPSTGAVPALTQASELVVTLYATANTYTFSAYDSSQTEVGQAASTGGSTSTRNNTAMAQKIVSSTASVTYGCTVSSVTTTWGIAATFKAQSSTQYNQSLPATTTVTAALSASKVLGQALAATTTVAVGFVRRVGKPLAVSVTNAVGFVRQVGKPLSATTTVSPATTKRMAANLAVATSVAVGMARTKVQSIALAAATTVTVGLAQVRSFLRSLDATTTTTVGFARRVGLTLSVATTVAPTIAQARSFLRTLGATTAAAVGFTKQVGKPLAATATVTPSMVLSRLQFLTLAATTTVTVAMSRAIVYGKALAAATTVAAGLARTVSFRQAFSVTTTVAVGFAKQVWKPLAVATPVTVGFVRQVGKPFAIAVSVAVGFTETYITPRAMSALTTVTAAIGTAFQAGGGGPATVRRWAFKALALLRGR
jgi:hypothetical protein